MGRIKHGKPDVEIRVVKHRVMVKRRRRVKLIPTEIKINPTTSALLEAIGEVGMRNREQFDRVVKE